MIRFSGLALRRGPKLLFENASADIHLGQRVGVSGRNGTGKSSLFAMLLGELGADRGDYNFPDDWVVAHVAQETPATSRSAIDYVMDGDAELRKLQHQLALADEADDGHRAALLHGRLEAIDGYGAKARAGRLLHGLGFSADEDDQPVNAFSGGWRMRLNLAQALMCRSDLLLLDEPTNHLDLDAVIWLEGWIRQYAGTLLLISHDRDFLDAVVTHVLHFENQRLTLYTGNYSAFEHLRAERLAAQTAAHRKQQQEVAHIKRYVDRFRAKATKARQAQSRLKALERMTLIAPAHVDSPFHFGFKPGEKLPRPLLRLEDLAAGYDDKVVIQKVNLVLAPGDRLGLLGPNGAGKSTLIKLLAGEMSPLSGKREPARDLSVGYFAQHQLEQLHPEHTPFEHLRQIDPDVSDQDGRNFLGGFGFNKDRALEPVGPFSGGEKARLVLALIVYRRPNLLLLDEPTNHLDLEMRQALADALQEFDGAMVIVSHDRHLLRVTCDALWMVHGGTVTPFDKTLDDYPRWLANQQVADEPVETEVNAHSASSRRDRKRQEAEKRKRLLPLKRELEKCEARLERLTEKQNELESLLADSSLYDEERKDDLRTILADKSALDQALEQAEAAWLAALETTEQAIREYQAS